MKNELVSAEWLKNNLSKEHLVILDCSPNSTVGGSVSPYRELCIPQARIFNIKEHFTNTESDFPNTVPTASQFEQACKSLGINANSEIIVYDNLGIYTSPRVWWLFHIMGHKNIRVLNGGLPEWINKGYTTIKKADVKKDYDIGDFKSHFKEAYVIHYNDVMDNIRKNKFLIIDARSEGRFNGTAPEPRKHLKSGSISNSINLPYQMLLENGKFKSPQQLKAIFEERINEPMELVFSCGSGMTACIVMLASEIAFKKSKYLYDGSWTEYASMNHKELPPQ